MKQLFVLAILIRLLIMPFYFHPDIKTYHFQASFLNKGIFNIYSYLKANNEKLPIKDDFTYFPLAYFFLGTYQIIVSPILGPDFNNWLLDASEQSSQNVGTFRYLFILKLPYLIIDLIIPFLLMRFFEDVKKKREVFLLWLFNPVSIAIVYIFSNFDIIPVALSMISILLFRKEKIALSGLSLGLAAGFKVYPLLFLPFMLLFVKNRKEVVKMLLMSLGTFILIVAPFWSSAFINSALISGLTTRIAFPGIPIGFGEALMVGVLSLAILFVITLTEERKKPEALWICIFQVLLLIFSTTHYHIQWLLWIMPFLTIFSIYQKQVLGKLSWVWLYLAFTIPLFYDDKSMTVSALSAISPLYNLLPTPFLGLQKFYDPYLAQSLIHSILFGIALSLIFRTYRLLKK